MSTDGAAPSGILKPESELRSPKKRAARIVWNEMNLMENDANRSSTMKIDEPKTPFNRDYADSDDEASAPAPVDPRALAARMQAAATAAAGPSAAASTSSPAAAAAAAAVAMPDAAESSEDEEAVARRHQAFVQHRKQHYREGGALRVHIAEDVDVVGGGDDDDDDDDGDDSAHGHKRGDAAGAKLDVPHP